MWMVLSLRDWPACPWHMPPASGIRCLCSSSSVLCRHHALLASPLLQAMPPTNVPAAHTERGELTFLSWKINSNWNNFFSGQILKPRVAENFTSSISIIAARFADAVQDDGMMKEAR